MTNSEKEILLLVSQVKVITETQLKRLFSTRSRQRKYPIKRILRKMCNDYVLNRYPCNINYEGYKENTYMYCLNGFKIYRGEELTKTLIGTDVAINMISQGYDIRRFYRNIKIDNMKYDLYVEYIDHKTNELKQKILDIQLDDNYRHTKYLNFKDKIKNCTIPFYTVPEIIIICDEKRHSNEMQYSQRETTINLVNLKLTTITKYL